LIISSVILLLFIVFGYLYYSTVLTDSVTVDSPNDTLVTEENMAQPESVDINTLAAEKLIEVDEGQNFVGVATSTAGDIYLVKAETGQTLYQLTDGFCVDECQQAWTPYYSDRSFEGSRLKSVLVNEEFDFHYVLLDDMMLFTYNEEEEDMGALGGNGVDGVWSLARP